MMTAYANAMVVDINGMKNDGFPYLWFLFYTKIGRIYAGEQGEQLLNVAISRAKHKLIIVCDPDYIKTSPGGVISNKSQTIFNSLLKARWTKL